MSTLTPDRRAELRFLAERTPLFWGDEELVAVAEDLPALLDALDAAEETIASLAKNADDLERERDGPAPGREGEEE